MGRPTSLLVQDTVIIENSPSLIYFQTLLVFILLTTIRINKIFSITETGKIFVRLDKFKCLLDVIKPTRLLDG